MKMEEIKAGKIYNNIIDDDLLYIPFPLTINNDESSVYTHYYANNNITSEIIKAYVKIRSIIPYGEKQWKDYSILSKQFKVKIDNSLTIVIKSWSDLLNLHTTNNICLQVSHDRLFINDTHQQNLISIHKSTINVKQLKMILKVFDINVKIKGKLKKELDSRCS